MRPRWVRKAVLAALTLLIAATSLAAPGVRLVVRITANQQRADLQWRQMDAFGPGGFGYLREFRDNSRGQVPS